MAFVIHNPELSRTLYLIYIFRFTFELLNVFRYIFLEMFQGSVFKIKIFDTFLSARPNMYLTF